MIEQNKNENDLKLCITMKESGKVSETSWFREGEEGFGELPNPPFLEECVTHRNSDGSQQDSCTQTGSQHDSCTETDL